MRVRFSLRLQLLILSLFLFAIPWLGYKYVWELEQYLRAGQEQTLLGTARSVATALHERPALFDSQSAYLKDVRPGTDLYAPHMRSPIQLDGRLADWQQVSHLSGHYDDNQVVTWFDSPAPRPEVSLAFEHMVGRYDNYLYALFKVTDDIMVWRGTRSLAVDRSDHLLIGVTNEAGEFQRYIISPYRPGWINAYRLDDSLTEYRAKDNELRIQGHWQQTATGYNIELRFPLQMTSGSLAFAIVDVDDNNQRLKQYAIGTANPNRAKDLGTVVTPSPEIERILAGLKYADSRVWVIDQHKRVLARSGDIASAAGFGTAPARSTSNSWWRYIEQEWLLPVYYRILTRPPAEFIDELEGAYALAGQDINGALKGEPRSLWRLTPDNKAVILSAAYPIFIDGQVRGAVVAEQTTNGIRTLRNRALEQLFHVILAVMLLGTTGLLLFASQISSRIRALRDDTEAVIDDNGKIIAALPPRARFDEIGDLSQSFANVLQRLQQYNSYLENMASRLSHELRTPVAVVRSSLDMLEQCEDKNAQAMFVARAQSGLTRLSKILNSMSEASRLEQAIAQEPSEPFVVSDVIRGCMDSYLHTYSDRQFDLQLAPTAYTAHGGPELFAQMLDKIVANAVEFSAPGSTIAVNTVPEGRHLRLSVANQGPLLPADMQDELLQSMVSVRPESGSTTHGEAPHLGLGLYIANMIAGYHKSRLSIANLPDNSGVEARLKIPVTNHP